MNHTHTEATLYCIFNPRWLKPDQFAGLLVTYISQVGNGDHATLRTKPSLSCEIWEFGMAFLTTSVVGDSKMSDVPLHLAEKKPVLPLIRRRLDFNGMHLRKTKHECHRLLQNWCVFLGLVTKKNLFNHEPWVSNQNFESQLNCHQKHSETRRWCGCVVNDGI